MPTRSPSPALTLLTASAFASGLAALILELQWGRQLALVFGGSHHAVAAVLSAFMLGLGVGSLVGGRVADRLRRPALAIVVIESILTILGPAIAVLLTRLPSIAADWLPEIASSNEPGFLISRLLAALVLLMVPTTLMGATYPILVRAVTLDVDTLHRGIGRLYASNTLGGVVGVAAAGFLVFPTSGIPGAVAVAAGANLAAAAAALLAYRMGVSREMKIDAPRSSSSKVTTELPWTLLVAAAGSGAIVLGAETLWHRALKMVLANSTATLTLLLAMTLCGLGLGAAIGAPLLRRSQPLAWWAKLQLAATGLVVVQAGLIAEIAVIARLFRPDTGWARVLVPPLTVGGLVILPAALLFGAAWPLLLSAATPQVNDGGRRIGRMGIANSFGAAAGAAVTGMLLLPVMGFGRSMLVVGAAGTGIVLIALTKPAGTASREFRHPRRLAAGVAVCLAIAVLFAPTFGRVLLPSLTVDDNRTVLSYHETPSGTVVVTEDPTTGARGMYVDNNAVIGATYDALKVARMLGLIPTLLHPDPQRVLVIGFGAGVTTATVAGDTEVESIDVVEIVPGVIEAADLFNMVNHDVVDDPRVRLHANDGRNHLLLNAGPWDVITCDPVHPLFGSSPLYSLDFFTLARSRLAPGGVVCQYLPLHRMPADAFRRAVATFQAAFPESWVLFGLGHAMFVGADGPLDLNWEQWRSKLEEHALRNDLATSALHHPAQIAALFQLDPGGCRAVAAGEPATDLHPRLEFLAPAAYEPGLWTANSRLLVESYTSPISRINNLPAGMDSQLQRLVAGKRLLLFSLLERADGNLEGARTWLGRAMQIAGDDPEIVFYGRQLEAETQSR